MFPRFVADRAIEVSGRTVRVWENGELVAECTFPAESHAFDVAKLWLSHQKPVEADALTV